MHYFDDKAWAAILSHEDTEVDSRTDEKAIAAFEAKHNFVLPDAHREFLLRANGGIVGYVRLFGVGRKDALDLEHQIVEIKAYIEGMAAGPILPIASEWGGSYFCYDLTKAPTPNGYPVLYWDHEYSEEPEDRPKVWSTFATDFVAFVMKVIKK